MSDTEAQLSTIQQSIQVLQQMIENINCRTIDIGKEQNKVKYMLDLKKNKQLSSSMKEMTEDDIKHYKVKQRMYLGKLQDSSIKLPKPQTLEYYKIVIEDSVYKISED